jgi:hypothetical protein
MGWMMRASLYFDSRYLERAEGYDLESRLGFLSSPFLFVAHIYRRKTIRVGSALLCFFVCARVALLGTIYHNIRAYLERSRVSFSPFSISFLFFFLLGFILVCLFLKTRHVVPFLSPEFCPRYRMREDRVMLVWWLAQGRQTVP